MDGLCHFEEYSQATECCKEQHELYFHPEKLLITYILMPQCPMHESKKY